jgi:hypothetical protein
VGTGHQSSSKTTKGDRCGTRQGPNGTRRDPKGPARDLLGTRSGPGLDPHFSSPRSNQKSTKSFNRRLLCRASKARPTRNPLFSARSVTPTANNDRPPGPRRSCAAGSAARLAACSSSGARRARHPERSEGSRDQEAFSQSRDPSVAARLHQADDALSKGGTRMCNRPKSQSTSSARG